MLSDMAENLTSMKKIWTDTAYEREGRDDTITACLEFYKELLLKLDSGEISEDNVFNPPSPI